MTTAFAALILAAGGEPGRGGEADPALLLGRPLLRFAVDAVLGLKPGFHPPLIVSGLDPSAAEAGFGDSAVPRVLVAPSGAGVLSRLGAARRALRARAEDDVLVLTADLPLLESVSLRGLLREHGRARNVLTVLTSGEDPERVLALAVSRRELLAGWNRIAASAAEAGAGANLDSLVGTFVFRKKRVGAVTPGRPEEALRVSDPYDLARAAAVFKERKIRGLCRAGVFVLDPATTWIGLDVEIGAGTVVYPGCVIEGRTVIGRGGRDRTRRPPRGRDGRRSRQGLRRDGRRIRDPRGRRPGRAVLPAPPPDRRPGRGEGREFRRDEENRFRPALQSPPPELSRR